MFVYNVSLFPFSLPSIHLLFTSSSLFPPALPLFSYNHTKNFVHIFISLYIACQLGRQISRPLLLTKKIYAVENSVASVRRAWGSIHF